MKTKLILFTLLSMQALKLSPAQALPGHGLEYCSRLEEAFAKSWSLSHLYKENEFLNDIKNAIQTCECCKKNAFTTLIKFYPEPLDYETATKIANLFIQNGISVNTLDDTGDLPIVNAASNLNRKGTHLLISLNADVNKQNRLDHTALMEAIRALVYDDHSRSKQFYTVEMLLTAGADPHKFNNDFPLHAATTRNLYGIVLLLLEHGADVNKKYGNQDFFKYAQHYPEALAALAAYEKYKSTCRQIIHDTVSTEQGFDQDMPDVLVDMINKY